MKSTIVWLMAALVAPSVAPAASNTAAPSGICTELSATIDSEQKQMSADETENLSDDSAPRETMRNVEMNTLGTLIGTNVALMGANHCAPYGHALESNAFPMSALKCANAESSASLAGKLITDDPAWKSACDRSTWERGFGGTPSS